MYWQACLKNGRVTFPTPGVWYSLYVQVCFSQISINNVNDAVNIALQNSKQIYLQELNSLITMKTSKLSFREFLPSVNFSYNDSSGVTYFSTDTNSKTFSVSLNQLLFDGGKLRFNYQINKLNSMYSYNAVTLLDFNKYSIISE